MRVLIVGCGYVGLPLGKELHRQGHEVFGLRRSAPEELSTAGIIPLRGDVSQIETLKKLPAQFDWVVNCAASGGGTAEDYRRLYLNGNRNLLSWLGAHPPQKFIYTSSTSVYAQNDGSLVTEESPTTPESATSQILVETEKMLLDAAQKGFPAIVARLAGIYGPERGYAFKQFLRGEANIEGDGSRHMNMIHLDDVMGGIIAVLESGNVGEIYNVTDSEPVKQLDFLTWLAKTLNRPLPPRVDANPEAWRKRGVTNKRVSNAKLLNELEYRLKYPDFRAGYSAEIARLTKSL